jgi:DNA-binding FadR family transcriptional regulator
MKTGSKEAGLLRRVRISDQVSDYVKAYIASHSLKPGDELPSESELSRRLGVSRPTIREATNALAGMGIINVSSGRVPTVGEGSGAVLPQIFGHALAIAQIDRLNTLQVRRFIEERSVVLAAANRSEEDISDLLAIVSQLRAAVGDLPAFSSVDIAFHKLLARASGNPLVRIIIDGITDVALQSSLSGLREIEDLKEWMGVFHTHRRIAEAVIAGDPDEAELQMKEHFDEALARMDKAAAASPSPAPANRPKR